jgi:hypothetical protein
VKEGQSSLVFSIQPIGPSAVRKGQEHGGNCMNIPPESQACKSMFISSSDCYANITNSGLAISSEWTDDANDLTARTQMRQLISSLQMVNRERGLLFDFQFMNDASYTQSPLTSYGPEMLAFLRDTSRKWDTQRTFQRLQNGGFLLSNLE